ncbi:hypothetical protein DSO57_1015725 [Entomophthora muscae]|uniref:Uncharacterized protein n=1 Tax=Entomophthora muscae TaxID=34485 RepID=A0ACC2RWC8_9FUNG|nr:hypothetical protein DSO57_1015725 [Entomophthora muscae]
MLGSSGREKRHLVMNAVEVEANSCAAEIGRLPIATRNVSHNSLKKETPRSEMEINHFSRKISQIKL